MAAIKDYIKAGFGLELGVMAANAIIVGIALLFYIPAFILAYMFKTNRAANIAAIVLAVLGTGVILLAYGGIIFSIILGHAGNNAIDSMFSSD